ncbi:transmembrane protein, putative, partial [Bodo saltans]
FGDELSSAPRESSHASTMSSVHFVSAAPQQPHGFIGGSQSDRSVSEASTDTDDCEDFIVKQDPENTRGQNSQAHTGDDVDAKPWKNQSHNMDDADQLPDAAHSSTYSQRIFSVRELLSLYKLLDGDHNGVVSTLDLFGFLSLHPQSIDLTVEKFYHTEHHHHSRNNHNNKKGGTDAAASSASSLHHHHRSKRQGASTSRGEGDSSIPVLVPHAGMSLLSSCPRGSIRDPILYQKFCQRRFRRGEVPLTSDLLGATWWVQQRLRADECAQRFVSFVLQMTSGLAVRSSSSQSPTMYNLTDFASPPAAARQRQYTTQQNVSSSSVDHRGHNYDDDDCVVVVPHVTFFSFQQLYYHCVGLLRSSSSSHGSRHKGNGHYMFAALDLPMLRKLLWFYEFLDIMSRSSGRQWDWILHHDPEEIKARKRDELFGRNDDTDDNNNKIPLVTRLSRVAESRSEVTVEDAQWVQRRFQYVQELIESGMLENATMPTAKLQQTEEDVFVAAAPPPTAPQPLYTSLPAVYWTFAAWDVPRGWFDVSVLQRLGERYMRHHTLRHARVMRQFLRQMWVSQHNAPPHGGSRTITSHHHAPMMLTAPAPGNGGSVKAPKQLGERSSSPSTLGTRIPPASSVAEKLALVQLSNRFLSFHHIQDRSASRSSSSKSSTMSSSASSQSGGGSALLASSSSAMFSDAGGSSGVFELPKSSVKSAGRMNDKAAHRRQGSSTTFLVDEVKQTAKTSDTSALGTCSSATNKNGLSSLVGRVARDGVNALWETMSNASTQASPHRPLLRRTSWQHQQQQLPPPRDSNADLTGDVGEGKTRRPASTTAASLFTDTNPTAGFVVNSSSGCDGAVETVVRQSLLHHDLTLHTILAPDMTLSAIPSMSGGDRVWLQRETRLLILRAALCALLSAILISLVDVMAQSWILQQNVSLFDTSAFADFSNFFSFTGLTSLGGESAEATTLINGTSVTIVVTTKEETPLRTIIKYYAAVVIGTLIFSLIEVVFLYLDTLQFCFKMAQTCGIPLEAAQREHHHNNSSDHHAASVKALKASFGRRQRNDGVNSNSSKDKKLGTRWDSLRSAVSGIIDSMAIGGGGGRRHGPGDHNSSSGFQVQQQLGDAMATTTVGTTLGGLDDDNRELRVIRQHLVRRRVRYIVAAITRCAMQIGFDPTTVLGLDVRDRNVSRLRLALSLLGERIKRVAPSVILRLLATRLLNRLLVPFVAVPVLVAWNIVLTQRSVFQARLVSLGTIGVERIARELLSSSFAITARVSQHNARLLLAGSSSARASTSSNQQHAAAAVQVPSTRPLFHVPYHCLQEMIMMVVFFSHCVQGPKEIHPFVHSLLVELLSSCELPDVCLWMIPKSKSASSSSRRRRESAKQQQQPSASLHKQRSRDTAATDDHEDEFSTPLQHSAKAKRPTSVSMMMGGGGGVDVASTIGGPTVSEALSPPRPGGGVVPDASWSKVLDLALVDVGGSAQCALSATLRTFTRELNRLRAASCENSSTADWLHLYVEACPWPMDLVQRIELRDHVRSWSILHPQRVDDARFNFLLESTFPSWASPPAMGPQAQHRRHGKHAAAFHHGKQEQQRGVATEVYTPSKTVIEILEDGGTTEDNATATNNGDVFFSDSDCTVELEHAAASDALRSATITSPFSLEHVKLFLTIGILLVVTTFAPRTLAGILGADPGPSSSRRLCRYLLHLRSAYIAALRNSREFGHQQQQGAGQTTFSKSYHDMHPVHCDLFLHNEQVNFLRGIDKLHASFWAGCPCLTVAEIHRIIDTTTPSR